MHQESFVLFPIVITKQLSDHSSNSSRTRTLYAREKILSIEKHKIFLFQVFDLRFFTQIFILQQCLDPNPNFFSDSNPELVFTIVDL
jgi:hypothetical protein